MLISEQQQQRGTFACIPRVSQLSRHSLALTQESGSGPDPVSECHDVGYQCYYTCIDISCKGVLGLQTGTHRW